jgi:ribonucleoside-diphosphate reductase alpha subunit
MKVIKRSGIEQDMLFDKVTQRIKKLSDGLSVVPDKVAQKTFYEMHDGISTTKIDDISADISANMMTVHPDYEILAARILVSNMHKTCHVRFSDFVLSLPTASDELISISAFFDEHIKYERDYDFGYFGLKTMQKVYMSPGETPQYMFMRVAIGIHGHTKSKSILETYELLSTKKMIHATPTMINAGMKKSQMSSCFLTKVYDSITDIYGNLSKCAQISKHAGGIGIHIQGVRSKGAEIKSTNGHSDGIIPMLKVYNATARYVNQTGKRKGSFAVYLEPWHPDIIDFLELRLNQGDEDSRCRDLFTALWIPDMFMEAVESGDDWALFDPSECPFLADSYGSYFKDHYFRYLSEGRAKKILPAITIWNAIIKSQVETGTPYMLYKDTCNSRSNQRHLGTLTGSNLCTEIIEFTNASEIAVCNLASLSLPAFIREQDGIFDYDELHRVTKIVTLNLNDVIDRNYYPVQEAKNSNMKHRPIGIGVQGLADVFSMLGVAFDSDEASEINSRIFETMYHAALEKSVELTKVHGRYESFRGSPASEGLLQFDLAGGASKFQWHYDWNEMRHAVRTIGLRNSLLIAPMPTATTSQVLGNNECFEPYTTNLYLRRTLAGEFVVVNRHLVKSLGSLWTPEMKDLIIRHNGSVQDIQEIPEHIRNIFKTAWEISPRVVINQARDRGYFICQSQSMNLFVEAPTIAKMSSIHMYAWKQGLKTGMYYLRTRPKAAPIQVTLDPTGPGVPTCTWQPGCTSCGA